ncbi:hypothetical protein [Roseateles amylovorans]|uniref:NodB homology domain-containing protein n=1 Tax=Roseateles amylovorans TaxID=2978473 RepID=A0ABY6B5B3_9BURK|nr:hypothetical protein [Roseateles amylovorans]UXH80119.1 hypothetical protein N4261_09645 [Roseateles amylovorans]
MTERINRDMDRIPDAASAAASGTISQTVVVSITLPAVATSGAPSLFPAQPCTELQVNNDTGTALEYTRDAGLTWAALLPGMARRIVGLTDASQLGWRRRDYAKVSASLTNRSLTVNGLALTSTEVFSLLKTLQVQITNGGGGTTLGANAIQGVEIVNTSAKDIVVRTPTTATSGVRLRVGQSLMVAGLSNTNQINLRPIDSVADANAGYVTVECFTAGLQTSLNLRAAAEQLGDNTRIPIGELHYPSQHPTVPAVYVGELAAGPRRTLHARGIKLADFTTVAALTSNAAAQCADMTDGEIYQGGSAIEFTQTAPGTYFFGSAGFLCAQGVDLSGGKGMVRATLSMPIGSSRFDAANALANLGLDIFSSGNAATPPADYHAAATLGSDPRILFATTEKVMYSFAFPIEKFAPVGAGATLSTIRWARFRLQTGAAGNGAKFRPLAIEFVPKALTKAICIFSIDDLNRGAYLNLLPVVSKYGYPVVLYADAVRAMSGTTLTASELAVLHQRHGWQVANQNYRLETGLQENMEQVIEQHSKYFLVMRSLGIQDIHDSSLGSAGTTNFRGDNFAALRRMHRSCALFLGGAHANPPLAWAETVPFGDPHRIARINMSGFDAGTLLQRWKDHLDQAIAQKGLAYFGGHSEFNASGEALTALPEFIEYVRAAELAGTVEVLSLAQAIERGYPR